MQYLGFFLLQTAAPSAQTNPLMSFLPLVFIVAIFYFLVFMPMQRQKKQQAAMLAGLQSGNEVVTTGGIVGTVVMFIVFVGIMVWAWSAPQKRRFPEAALIPFQEDDEWLP